MASGDFQTDVDPVFWPWISVSSAGVKLDPADIEKIRSAGIRRYYKKGTIISPYGEDIKGIFFLHKGEVTGKIFSLNGTEKVLYIYKPPCFFQESPYLAELPSNMEIKASADSELTFIDRPQLDHLLATDSAFSHILMKHMARKNRLVLDQLIDMVTLSPIERIHKVLLANARQQGKPAAEGVAVALTQDQLATITGLHRVTVARALAKLKAAGAIKKSSKALIVIDPDYKG
jgi:CRP-like cAMP-binding protein